MYGKLAGTISHTGQSQTVYHLLLLVHDIIEKVASHFLRYSCPIRFLQADFGVLLYNRKQTPCMCIPPSSELRTNRSCHETTPPIPLSFSDTTAPNRNTIRGRPHSVAAASAPIFDLKDDAILRNKENS
jgi:hypothetical protein